MRPSPTLLRNRRARRGNHAIEFVLCLPVWIMVVAGILDYGWYYFQQTSLDMAANMGCRSGSLVDPGSADENMTTVIKKAEDTTWASLAELGTKDCSDCTMLATTEGIAPTRTLVCEVSQPMKPLVGLVLDKTSLTSRQVARLEYQHMGG